MKALIGSFVLVLLFIGLLDDTYLAVGAEYVGTFVWNHAWLVFLIVVFFVIGWIGVKQLIRWVLSTGNNDVWCIEDSSLCIHKNYNEIKSNKLNRKGL